MSHVLIQHLTFNICSHFIEDNKMFKLKWKTLGVAFPKINVKLTHTHAPSTHTTHALYVTSYLYMLLCLIKSEATAAFFFIII